MSRSAALLVLVVVLAHTTIATDLVIFDLEEDEEISRHRTGRDVAGSGSGHPVLEGSGEALKTDCLDDGSGSEGHFESSGSGCINRVTPKPPKPSPTPNPTCVKPPLSQDQYNTVDQDKAVQRARCHSACLNHILPARIVKNLKDSKTRLWQSVSLTTLRGNCSLIQQVFECRTACEIAGAEKYHTVESCVNQVFLRCTSLVIPDTSCLRICGRSLMRLGCEVNTNLSANHSTGPLFQFFTAPRLTEAEGILVPGAFSIHPPDVPDLPFYSGSVTMFVVKVKDSEEDRVSHYVLGSLSDPLILDSYFICEEVSVSIAVVDQFTKTLTYSPPTNITPTGDRWPSYPANVLPHLMNTEVVKDNRFGFWNHSNITVAWHTPNRLNYVDHYQVVLISDSDWCGNTTKYTIPEVSRSEKGRREFTIAAAKSYDAPLSGCSYDVIILSQPRTTTFPGTPQPYKIRPLSFSIDPVPVEFSCTREYVFESYSGTIGTYLVTVQWTIPNDHTLIKAIHRFEVKRYLHVTGDEDSVNMADNLKVHINKTQFQYTAGPFNYMPANNENVQYVVELHTLRSHRVPRSQPLPLLQTCKFDTTPPSPSPPKDFSLDNFVLYDNGTLALNLFWNQPEQTYGLVTYILYVGFDPLNSTNVRPDNALLWVEQLSDTGAQQIMFGNFTKNLVDVHLKRQRTARSISMDFTVYVQVTAKNIVSKKFSQWSNPVPINIQNVPIQTALPTSSQHSSIQPTSTIDPHINGQNGLPFPPTYLGVILVVVALLIAIVVVAALLCFAYVQNRRVARREKEGFGSTKAAQLGIMNPRVYLDKWEVSQQDLVVGPEVGQGTFGNIHSGNLLKSPAQMKKEWSKEEFPKPVFIKFLRTNDSVVDQQEFYLQLDRWKRISGESHPFLLEMLGCKTHTEPVCLLLEYAENGDLLSFLLNKRKELETRSVQAEHIEEGPGVYSRLEPKQDPLKPTNIITFSVQIASAMECLAARGIIHRDLACRNIYITADNTLKVADFGIVATGRREQVYVESQTLSDVPLRWLSIEAIIDQMFSSASDVWAYGVTLWEILTLGDFPYKEVADKDILSNLMSGHRLQKPQGCSPQFFSILDGCWDSEPNRRPSFELLHETLLNILQRSDCSQLVNVKFSVTDITSAQTVLERQPGKTASSPTNESSDSAISEGEMMMPASPEGNIQTVDPPPTKKSSMITKTSTDLDTRIKQFRKTPKTVTSACNIVFIEEDPVPTMNPDGSTEI